MHKIQMSETAKLGAILSFSGGFIDVYSYVCRGGVFANAQTGNLVLLGINISKMNWSLSIRYLTPILAFFIGIMVTEIIRHKTSGTLIHWRQITLLLEIGCLIIVAFFPEELNLIANSILSIACGMQVESFRKIHGNGINTAMCLNNLRSGTENLFKFLHHKEKHFLKKTGLYYGLIFSFILGGITGNFLTEIFWEKAILICIIFFLIAFIMMFFEEKKTIAIK